MDGIAHFWLENRIVGKGHLSGASTPPLPYIAAEKHSAGRSSGFSPACAVSNTAKPQMSSPEARQATTPSCCELSSMGSRRRSLARRTARGLLRRPCSAPAAPALPGAGISIGHPYAAATGRAVAWGVLAGPKPPGGQEQGRMPPDGHQKATTPAHQAQPESTG